MKFLHYDSPFMTGFRRIVDYVCLGMLWIVASIPIFTFGAATTAMLQTAHRSIYKDEGKIFRPFWKYFRKEFRQATIVWLIQLPIICLLGFNYLLVQQQIHPVFQVLVSIASLVIFSWLQLWFGYLSMFEDTNRKLLSNTFILTLGNLGRTLLMGILAAVILELSYLAFVVVPPASFLIPGIYIMLYTPLLRKLIQKNVPQMSSAQV